MYAKNNKIAFLRIITRSFLDIGGGMDMQKNNAGPTCALKPWVTKGVTFPQGTEFRGKYKGYFFYAKVNGGALVLNGKEFLSPSAAAISITRNPVDGWFFWYCKLPGSSCWESISEFRK